MGKAIERVSDKFTRDVVNAAFVNYTMTKQPPTLDGISATLKPVATTEQRNKFNVRVAKVMSSAAFTQTCEARGIPLKDKHLGITSAQVYATAIILNPADKRSLEAKYKSAGITAAIYQNWMRQPQFAAYVNQLAEDVLSMSSGEVNTMLVNRATSGDTTAMRMFYELRGQLGNNSDKSTQDLQQIISMLLEVITRHLASTPLLLQAISADITKIINGDHVDTSLPILEGTVVSDPYEHAQTQLMEG
jgi:hypothetical protein